MVGPKYRVVAGTLCQYYYTFGFFTMCLVAYFLNNNWHLLPFVQMQDGHTLRPWLYYLVSKATRHNTSLS